MASRAILLIALALFSTIAYVDGASEFPSRKASVVVPILRKLSPEYLPEAHTVDQFRELRSRTLDQIGKILGRPDRQVKINIGYTMAYCYDLDDKSFIAVIISEVRLESVTLRVAGKSPDFLYISPKP